MRKWKKLWKVATWLGELETQYAHKTINFVYIPNQSVQLSEHSKNWILFFLSLDY